MHYIVNETSDSLTLLKYFIISSSIIIDCMVIAYCSALYIDNIVAV